MVTRKKGILPVYSYGKDGEIIQSDGIIKEEDGPESYVDYYDEADLLQMIPNTPLDRVEKCIGFIRAFNWPESDGRKAFGFENPVKSEEIFDLFDEELFNPSEFFEIEFRLLICIHPDCPTDLKKQQKSVCIIITMAITTSMSFVFCTRCKNFFSVRGPMPTGKYQPSFSYLRNIATSMVDENRKRSAATKSSQQSVILSGKMADDYKKWARKRSNN